MLSNFLNFPGENSVENQARERRESRRIPRTEEALLASTFSLAGDPHLVFSGTGRRVPTFQRLVAYYARRSASRAKSIARARMFAEEFTRLARACVHRCAHTPELAVTRGAREVEERER